MPDAKTYLTRTLCVMVVVPVIFLAVYPVIYLFLPETIQRLADLPQDVSVMFLVSEAAIPLFSALLYARIRHRSLSRSRGAGQRLD